MTNKIPISPRMMSDGASVLKMIESGVYTTNKTKAIDKNTAPISHLLSNNFPPYLDLIAWSLANSRTAIMINTQVLA